LTAYCGVGTKITSGVFVAVDFSSVLASCDQTGARQHVANTIVRISTFFMMFSIQREL
jgi:hypothetical protein